VDLGAASELDLVILDPEWSGSGRTGAPGAPDLYLNRTVLYPNRIVYTRIGWFIPK
jgi:hypothetical protein